jgi:hypothetical protein
MLQRGSQPADGVTGRAAVKSLNCTRAKPIVKALRWKECEMQIPSKAYKHFISICRSLQVWVSPHDQNIEKPLSPWLVYTALSLAMLLTLLEIDLHRAELGLMWLINDKDQADPILFGP